MPEFDPNHRIILSRAIASWFVRRDGKYYDIDNYTTKLALPDVLNRSEFVGDHQLK